MPSRAVKSVSGASAVCLAASSSIDGVGAINQENRAGLPAQRFDVAHAVILLSGRVSSCFLIAPRR